MALLIRNKTTGTVIAGGVEIARGRLERLIGLIGRVSVASDAGLWFDRCRAIHTLFVRAPLDVIWLDRDLRVVEMAINVRPWTFAVTCSKAHSVLELGSGATRDVLVGDTLSFEAQALVREPFTLHASDVDSQLERFAS
ncbi:MAG TPA: DUF192 domain-containing protein [Candidatus Baltobacteraceae bacterium]|jgi:hypothetical protein